MLNRDSEETVLEERLESLYQKVMEIEKFAEAKNALLLTFISAILVLLYDVFGSAFYSFPNFFFGIPIYLSLGTIILSFLPYKDSKKNPDKKKIAYQVGMNLFNVKDLAKLSYDDKQLYSTINPSGSSTHDEYQRHLLEGILFNSRITRRKLLYFSLSIYFLFVIPAVIVGIKYIIDSIQSKRNK